MYDDVGGAGMPATQVDLEPSTVAVSRRVDVQVLVLEEVDRHCALAGASQERQQHEQLAVVDPDLGDVAGDTGVALGAFHRVDERQSQRLEPSVDRVPSEEGVAKEPLV